MQESNGRLRTPPSKIITRSHYLPTLGHTRTAHSIQTCSPPTVHAYENAHRQRGLGRRSRCPPTTQITKNRLQMRSRSHTIRMMNIGNSPRLRSLFAGVRRDTKSALLIERRCCGGTLTSRHTCKVGTTCTSQSRKVSLKASVMWTKRSEQLGNY